MSPWTLWNSMVKIESLQIIGIIPVIRISKIWNIKNSDEKEASTIFRISLIWKMHCTNIFAITNSTINKLSLGQSHLFYFILCCVLCLVKRFQKTTMGKIILKVLIVALGGLSNPISIIINGARSLAKSYNWVFSRVAMFLLCTQLISLCHQLKTSN